MHLVTSYLASVLFVSGHLGQTALGHSIPRREPNACQRLAQVYGNKTSLLGTSQLALVSQENWSEAAQLTPNCTFEPATADDVSGALRILVSTKTKFAVRSGGHMPNPGSSNINGGVLISLTNLKTLKLNSDHSIVSVGAGYRWGDVYQWLSGYGLVAAGGRYEPVGVPGFLLGGGITFFGSRHGWGANNIANMEVVLANGTIVNGNATRHSDLFWALKGGSSNYGIVTRLDLKTLADSPMYGGTTAFQPDRISDFVDAIASYSTVGGGSDDPNASYNPSVQVIPATGQVRLFSFCGYRGNDPSPAAFANFSQIPVRFTNNSVRANLWGLVGDTMAEDYHARTHRQLFWGTALKATPASVYLINETFFETFNAMAPRLQNATGLSLTTTPQLISRAWISAAKASGGDPMDIDAEGGVIAHLITSRWEDAADDAVVYEFNRRCTEALDRKAKAKGLYYPFIYLNNAGPGQDPFKLYGQGKSLPKMQAVRDLYDPTGVFQELMPGGFKVGYGRGGKGKGKGKRH
ncbi:hypothetical protein V8F06_012309 [Rhypophila decipiens]